MRRDHVLCHQVSTVFKTNYRACEWLEYGFLVVRPVFYLQDFAKKHESLGYNRGYGRVLRLKSENSEGWNFLMLL